MLLVLASPREVVVFPPALVQIHQFVRTVVTERDVDLPARDQPVSSCAKPQARGGARGSGPPPPVSQQQKGPQLRTCRAYTGGEGGQPRT